MRTLSTASLLAVFACTTSTLFAQVSEKTYLKSNLIDFRKSDDLISQETINAHQILLVGETHGFQANYEIAQKLMTEYKRKTDFQYILAEMDWGSTQQLNELINKKDTAGIRAFMNLTKGSPAWCKELFAYYHSS